MLAGEPRKDPGPGERMPQLVHKLTDNSDPGLVICGGLWPIRGKPSLKLASRHCKQFSYVLLRDAQRCNGEGQNITDWSIGADRPVRDDVPQRLAKMLE